MSHLSLNEYQISAAANAFFNPDSPVTGLYEALGLEGVRSGVKAASPRSRTGEVLEKVKKYWRDGGEPTEIRAAIRGELGDVLWYLSQLARRYSLTLEEVATANLEKLDSRRRRGVLSGSGDNR